MIDSVASLRAFVRICVGITARHLFKGFLRNLCWGHGSLRWKGLGDGGLVDSVDSVESVASLSVFVGIGVKVTAWLGGKNSGLG